MMAPRGVIPAPVNVTRERMFADVRKPRILWWGDYPGLCRWAPHAVTGLLIKGKGGGWTQTWWRRPCEERARERFDNGSLKDWTDVTTSQDVSQGAKQWIFPKSLLTL